MIIDAIKAFFAEQVLGPLIGVLVTAIIGWLAWLYTKLTGQNLEARHRDALQSALDNGIRAAIQLVLKGKLNPDGTVPEAARTTLLMEAKDYVTASVPGAIKHFGLSEKAVVDLLVPHMPNTNDKPVAESLTK